ncbi:class I SAM-dependent methyltransferase [Patescibacteria group bacterium]|nr:class I SAM-dependent methyltransferase [Patescibacteria group bacterium]
MTKQSKHPLELWKSQEVTNLLIEFYELNFQKAGLPKHLASEFILTVWDNRNTDKINSLRRKCDGILLVMKRGIINRSTEPNPMDFFDLSKINSFLDIGANKLTTINYYAKKHANIKKFIGVDITPQKKPFFDSSRSIYYTINPDNIILPIKPQSIDFINIKFVFHHFKDLESITNTLNICSNLIKPGGALLLWEESFKKNFNDETYKTNNALGIQTNKNLTTKLHTLSTAKRWEFIIVNDWLINISNNHMPWTRQYYTWEEWVKLLHSYNFSLQKEYNFGLRVNALIKQGVHMIGLFKKL